MKKSRGKRGASPTIKISNSVVGAVATATIGSGHVEVGAPGRKRRKTAKVVSVYS